MRKVQKVFMVRCLADLTEVNTFLLEHSTARVVQMVSATSASTNVTTTFVIEFEM